VDALKKKLRDLDPSVKFRDVDPGETIVQLSKPLQALLYD
jgi:peptidoglycan hydrolase-like protein with peptidoglycan-binding domain